MLQMPIGCLFRSQTLTGPRLAARFWVRRVHWAGASLQESGTAVPVEDQLERFLLSCTRRPQPPSSHFPAPVSTVISAAAKSRSVQ